MRPTCWRRPRRHQQLPEVIIRESLRHRGVFDTSMVVHLEGCSQVAVLLDLHPVFVLALENFWLVDQVYSRTERKQENGETRSQIIY